jgi:hypothetical protein
MQVIEKKCSGLTEEALFLGVKDEINEYYKLIAIIENMIENKEK